MSDAMNATVVDEKCGSVMAFALHFGCSRGGPAAGGGLTAGKALSSGGIGLCAAAAGAAGDCAPEGADSNGTLAAGAPAGLSVDRPSTALKLMLKAISEAGLVDGPVPGASAVAATQKLSTLQATQNKSSGVQRVAFVITMSLCRLDMQKKVCAAAFLKRTVSILMAENLC